MKDEAARRQTYLRLGLLLLIAALFYLPPIWTRDLWNPDEPKYAEATRMMVQTGEYIRPQLNGRPYYEKPPLFFWLSAIAGSVPGIPPGSGGRLVSALAAAGTMILTWRIGALIMGEATGMLASLLLSTSLIFWTHSQTGIIDPLLTFFCTLAVFGFACHLRGRPRGMLLFYSAAALGVMAKGPVGFLIPGLAVLVFSILHGGIRKLKPFHSLWGIPLVFGPISLWLLAGTAAGGGTHFLETMVFKQTLGRAVDAYVHQAPPYYFLLVLPVALLPWCLFLPHAIGVSWREKVCGIRPMLLPLSWFVSTLVLFSIISSKKTRYLLPLAPAFSLMISGWMMRRMLSGSGAIRTGRLMLMMLSLAGAGIGCALAGIAISGVGALPAFLREPLILPGSEEALASVLGALTMPRSLLVLLPSLLLAGCSFTAGVMIWRRQGRAFPLMLSGWILFLAAVGLFWVPVLNEVKSARPLAEEIRPLVTGRSVYFVRDSFDAGINFYLPAVELPVIREPVESRIALERHDSRLLGSTEQLRILEQRSGTQLEREACRRVGSRILCLARVRTPETERSDIDCHADCQPTDTRSSDPA